MRERRWLLLALYGLLLASAVSGALKATRPKFKIATTSTTTTTTEEPDVADNEDGDTEATTASGDVNATTTRVLTGIPQIDYIWDPNLPRELNGFNLSEYPFYSGIPEEITFKCDGLHDGFYASVLHKCQVYHHCLFGTRYDFLCANFTAFDQRTFICHFASEVDCANSKKFWHRNDALYKTAETTTVPTTSTSTPRTTTTMTTTMTTTTQSPGPAARPGSRRRRPYRRRPAYDYYEEEYYDDEAYERTRPRGYDRRDDYDYDDRKYTRRDRDRDRNFRDRDYRDRELPRSREPDRPLREPERSTKDEAPLSPRERFPSRNNRRDPVRSAAAPTRDSDLEDEPRNRNRDQESPMRAREHEESSFDDRRPLDSRNREVDDRRYSEKGYADDYEDEPTAPASSSGSSDVLVKPAAPISSVYARPRAPPKIRRPVPITEQEKFAYKATSGPPIAVAEARRRPVETPVEDDYYEDELEEVRPRRPATRRRPGFRDFYENPRERDRDRPFRTRYREEMEDVRPRKHSERNRERYYERGPERGRDRSLVSTKDRAGDRIPESTRDRPGGRIQETDRPMVGRPVERERDIERSRSSSRSREPADVLESTRRPSVYERTSVSPPTTTTQVFKDDSGENSSDRPFGNGNRQDDQSPGARSVPIKTVSENVDEQDYREHRVEKERHVFTRLESPGRDENFPKEVAADKPRNGADEYSSVEDEYYDEPEYRQPVPLPPPRTTVRIVKRPFLPSRGGNPNPRGLLPVGSRAPDSSRKEESPFDRSPIIKSSRAQSEVHRVSEDRENTDRSIDGDNNEDADDKGNYDTHKFIKPDVSQKTRSEDYEEVLSRPAPRRPVDNDHRDDERVAAKIVNLPNDKIHDEVQSSRISSNDNDGDSHVSTLRNGPGTRVRTMENEDTTNIRDKSVLKWNSEEYRLGQRGDVRHDQETTQSGNNGASANRVKFRLTENSGYYDSRTENNNEPDQRTNLTPGNLAVSKQTLNEVVNHHRLQDIPESEYDVTLNEALTPSFNNQETNLPSGFVLPINRQQLGRDTVLQSTENSYKVSRPYNQQVTASQSHQQQQQKPFVPSPQFLPLAGIAGGNDNERSRSVQYFRTPEAVHVTGPQYRHQRGPWHDYTGY